jgi:hypothetical protein
VDPFQPIPSFGNLGGSPGSGVGFNGAGRLGAGWQGMDGSSPFGGSGIGGRQGNRAPLFPTGSASASDGGRQFDASPFALPSLNQLMRESFNLPSGSSSSSFKFSYQDALRPYGTSGDPGRPSASALFSTSDLGNGMVLSAGYGSHPIGGAAASGLGSGATGNQKHSGPSVNLRLSF